MADPLVFDHYQKALDSLKAALDAPLDEDDFVRDSTIQRFEYCVELSWKMLKRFLKIVYEVDESAVRELFRLAERRGLIKDAAPWIVYIDRRNLTSHTYNEQTAMKVYETARDFHADAQALLKAMKDGYERHKG